MLDAGPLIYLTKLDALDELKIAVTSTYVTPAVLQEVVRPQLAYRHPDAVVVEEAVDRGTVELLTPTVDEGVLASTIAERVAGLHAGETEVLAVSITRSMPAVIFERRARRVAASLGADLVDLTELLVAGTTERAILEARIVRFARMVNMRLDDLVELLARIGSDRLGRSGRR